MELFFKAKARHFTYTGIYAGDKQYKKETIGL